MPAQEIKTSTKKEVSVIISVYFFTLVGIISLFTILFAGFFTFVLPKLTLDPGTNPENEISAKSQNLSRETDRYFETIIK